MIFDFEKISSKTLDNFLKTRKIPHALLFIGRDILYLKKQAYLFASKVLINDNTKKTDLDLYSNIFEFYPKGKLEIHSIDTIRQIILETWKPNFNSLPKIFIIYSAERMLPSASSALLKIFEEPQDNIFIILVSSKVEKISSSILSRSVFVTFKQVLTITHEIRIDLFNLIRKFSFSYLEISKFYQQIESICKKDSKENEIDLVKQEIKNILEIVYLFFRDKFILDNNLNKKLLSFPEQIEITKSICSIPIEKIHLIVQQAGEALEKSTSKQFVLEWLFLQIEKLSLFYCSIDN